jgi:hypothetical protein
MLSKCVDEDKNKKDTVQRIYTRTCGLLFEMKLASFTAKPV